MTAEYLRTAALVGVGQGDVYMNNECEGECEVVGGWSELALVALWHLVGSLLIFLLVPLLSLVLDIIQGFLLILLLAI